MSDKGVHHALDELRRYAASGEAVFRVNRLGRRGLRWVLLALDERTREALLQSADGREQYRAHLLDVEYAPVEVTAGQTKAQARQRLADTWKQLRSGVTIDAKGYVSRLQDNLIEGVAPEFFRAELEAGRGRELDGKFLAVHSSSAMAVNTFAPWKRDLDLLALAGASGFTRLRFEQPCDIFADGNPAFPDFVAEARDDVVAVEAKLLEPLDTPKADFKPAYDSITDGRVHTPWFALIPFLRANPTYFRRLKADQLVKHALGLLHCYPDQRITLVYLYWEPLNAGQFPAYDRHRREVEEFAAAVAGEAVRFVPMTYADLWDGWTGRTEPEWLPAHLDRLRNRYRVSI